MLTSRGLAALAVTLATVALAGKPPYTLTGRVVSVSGGDTLTILDGEETPHKIRLAGIAAPEKTQPFGTKAREHLASKVFSETVRVEVVDVDRHQREVGRVFLGKRFVNLEMVADGFAWRSAQSDKPGEFTSAQADAREHRRGLWADPNPVPPWEWRPEKHAAAGAR